MILTGKVAAGLVALAVGAGAGTTAAVTAGGPDQCEFDRRGAVIAQAEAELLEPGAVTRAELRAALDTRVPCMDPAPPVEPTTGPTDDPPTQPPAPEPEPTPPPTTEPEPAPAGWPDADTTGPDGQLKLSGSVKADRDGQVIENLAITGNLEITATDVKVRNVSVRSSSLYPVRVRKGASATIEDIEVAATVNASIAVFIEGPTTLKRAEIRGGKDSLRIEADDVTIADSWIHSLIRVPGGHHDTIQIRRGVGITIRHNTLTPRTAAGDPMNAAIQIGSALGDVPISGLLVEGNYMAGGNYTINGGSTWVTQAVYRDNVIEDGSWRYGPRTNMGSGSVWEDSNRLDSGQLIR